MRAIISASILLALCVLTACDHQSRRPVDSRWTAEARGLPVVTVSEFMRLSAMEKERRRATADQGLKTLRLWSHKNYAGAELDFEMDTSPRDLLTITRYKKDGVEFDETVRTCRRAVEIDPSYTRVWYELGRIGIETGDWSQAMSDLDTAWEALPRDARTRADPYLIQHIILAGAWLRHDMGLWEDGLAWLDRHQGAWGVDESQEAMLAKGLLQAGAGQFTEAYITSLRLPPFRVRYVGAYATGQSKRQAGYGARWIQAMCWFHKGQRDLARHALGTPASSRIHIPQMTRYWTDVALLFETHGEIYEARFDYALTLLGRVPMLYYMPIEAYSFPPVMFDEPDVTLPFMTIAKDKFVAGSLFSYACQVMADCSGEADSALRMRRGSKAIEAFSICMRRGNRPVIAQALRGRTRFYMGQGEAALPDLLAGHRAMKEQGRVDPITSTVIGTLYMQTNDPADALPYLDEALEVDPKLAVAWRTYGVTLARVNRHAEADAAMDRAIDLNPYAVSGWYNRGLHHINLKRFAQAQEDLLIAGRIEPDNAQIKQLMTTLDRRWDQADDERILAAAIAKADSVQAELSAGDALPSGAGDDLAFVGGRRLLDLAEVDFEARADSLSKAYERSPDPATRETLAEALLRAGQVEQTLDLLGPYWLKNLSPVERMLVLQADRDLGRLDRARRLTAGLSDGDVPVSDMDFWTIVALICIDGGDRGNGLRALDCAIGLAPANSALTSFRRMLVVTEGE